MTLDASRHSEHRLSNARPVHLIASELQRGLSTRQVLRAYPIGEGEERASHLRGIGILVHRILGE